MYVDEGWSALEIIELPMDDLPEKTLEVFRRSADRIREIAQRILLQDIGPLSNIRFMLANADIDCLSFVYDLTDTSSCRHELIAYADLAGKAYFVMTGSHYEKVFGEPHTRLSDDLLDRVGGDEVISYLEGVYGMPVAVAVVVGLASLYRYLTEGTGRTTYTENIVEREIAEGILNMYKSSEGIEVSITLE